jgi:hypothetical protein
MTTISKIQGSFADATSICLVIHHLSQAQGSKLYACNPSSLNYPGKLPTSTSDIIVNSSSHRPPKIPSTLSSFSTSLGDGPPACIAKMAAMFSQNPLMNGPHYATTDAPKTNNYREHRFYP